MDRNKNRAKENSEEYNAFLDSYKTDDNLPYYLYSGQADTRAEGVKWYDLEACKDLKQIAPTGSIYLRHDKIEMLCHVSEYPECPGFIVTCKDEDGTPVQLHICYDPKKNELQVHTSQKTDKLMAPKKIHEHYGLPFAKQNEEQLIAGA